MSKEEMESRLQALQALLPDVLGRLPSLRPQLIAQLASDPQVRPLALASAGKSLSAASDHRSQNGSAARLQAGNQRS